MPLLNKISVSSGLSLPKSSKNPISVKTLSEKKSEKTNGFLEVTKKLVDTRKKVIDDVKKDDVNHLPALPVVGGKIKQANELVEKKSNEKRFDLIKPSSSTLKVVDSKEKTTKSIVIGEISRENPSENKSAESSPQSGISLAVEKDKNPPESEGNEVVETSEKSDSMDTYSMLKWGLLFYSFFK